jgi:hypothetical protein
MQCLAVQLQVAQLQVAQLQVEQLQVARLWVRACGLVLSGSLLARPARLTCIPFGTLS